MLNSSNKEQEIRNQMYITFLVNHSEIFVNFIEQSSPDTCFCPIANFVETLHLCAERVFSNFFYTFLKVCTGFTLKLYVNAFSFGFSHERIKILIFIVLYEKDSSEK